MLLKETGGGGLVVGTMKKNLAKDREYEKIHDKLKEEFSGIDTNNDGTISFEEIEQFLNSRTGGVVDTQIAE
jgi:Ca2+-binding EF-hand superfamily protein